MARALPNARRTIQHGDIVPIPRQPPRTGQADDARADNRDFHGGIGPWGRDGGNPGINRDTAIATLKAHEAELRLLGVAHLFLFGSTARGEAREESDVDLFFDHPEGSLGLYDLIDVKNAAARILGRDADIMTRRSLHPILRDDIEAGAVQVF